MVTHDAAPPRRPTESSSSTTATREGPGALEPSQVLAAMKRPQPRHDDPRHSEGPPRRKLRTALTAFAIVLGVAMVSGAYVVTDTMLGAGRSSRTRRTRARTPSSRRRRRSDDNSNGGSGDQAGAGVAGGEGAVGAVVAIAQGEIADTAKLTKKNGKVINNSVAHRSRRLRRDQPGRTEAEPVQGQEGRVPDPARRDRDRLGDGEAAALQRRRLVGASALGPIRQYRITGIVTLRRRLDRQRNGLRVLAQGRSGLFKRPGTVDDISCPASPAPTRALLGRRSSPCWPAGVEVAVGQGAGPVDDIKG